MNLPGQPYTATDSSDLVEFLDAVCEPCSHLEYCSIMAHAGMYGGASEWRDVGGKPVCTRQEVG